jgi:hypothetical protein
MTDRQRRFRLEAYNGEQFERYCRAKRLGLTGHESQNLLHAIEDGGTVLDDCTASLADLRREGILTV